jgi:hypothetical protein
MKFLQPNLKINSVPFIIFLKPTNVINNTIKATRALVLPFFTDLSSALFPINAINFLMFINIPLVTFFLCKSPSTHPHYHRKERQTLGELELTWLWAFLMLYILLNGTKK